MAKGSRGGRRSGVAPTPGKGASISQSNTPARKTGVANATQTRSYQNMDDNDAQAFSANYDNFMAMSDDQKADAISNLASQDVPVFLANNDFQKFTYNLGLNDKPQLVDDSVLDTMNGTELFRTVNSVNDTQNRMKWDADTIASQIQRGSVTRVSDSGGSAYGRGIYFADDYQESGFYGNSRGNIKKTAVVRAKLNSNAKVIDYSTATSGVRSEISRGTKLGKALQKCDGASRASIYAMAKGYNVLTSGHGYYNILSRNAVTMSKTIKASGSKW